MTVLAIGLVAASAAVVAVVAVHVTGLPAPIALLLGAVTGADPGRKDRVGAAIGVTGPAAGVDSAEGLFNDASSLVLFVWTIDDARVTR